MTLSKAVNPKGFTIVEVMVALVLAAVVGFMVLSGIAFISKRGMLVQQTGEMDADSRILARTLQNYLATAVNLEWTSSPITSIPPNQPGRLRRNNFTSGFVATGNPNPITVGVFLREAGDPRPGHARGDLRATAIYYQPPTAMTSGALLFSSPSHGVGTVTLSSAEAGLRFENLVEFEVSPVGNRLPAAMAPLGQAVRTVMIRTVTRKSLDVNKSHQRFCPENEMGSRPECRAGKAFKDMERILYIALPNNSLPTDQFGRRSGSGTLVPREETLFGDLYFFSLRM